ncbi:MAG TPA: ABC transporter substrate-binding protein, partial [Anaeromyxobacteraceae bacterium]|nr:ABC transporter substrate-binding protein [Anaeromyxobacteraceae bacterium]
LIVRQARELGLRQPLMGGDGWDSAKLFEIGGRALDGCYYSNHYSADDPNPRIQEFVTRFKAKFGAVPDTMAALGFDAGLIAADAMTRATDLTGAAIRDAIEGTKGFPGVTGVITIDADHNAAKPAVVLMIQGGAAKWVATVSPDAPSPAPAPAPAK